MSLGVSVLYSETRVKILENLKQRQMKQYLLDMRPPKPKEVYNLRMNIVMESVHVVFDDKKIQGLMDEGNHGISPI